MSRVGCRGGSPSTAPGLLCGSPVGVCSPCPGAGRGLECCSAPLPSRSKQKDAGSVAQADGQQPLPPCHPLQTWGPSQSVAGASLEKRGRKQLFRQWEAKTSPLAVSRSVPQVNCCKPTHRAAQVDGLCQRTQSSIPAPSIPWCARGGGSMR